MGIPGSPCGGPALPPAPDLAFTVAASLRDAATDALGKANWSGGGLVSHAEAGIPLGSPCGCDQLAVWVKSADPKALVLAVRLSFACWPTVEGGTAIQYPSAEGQETAARWSYLWACIAHSASHAWAKHLHMAEVGPRTPIAPSGGCAGWLWDVNVPIRTTTLETVESIRC